MKTDITTAVISAIAGILIAYFVVNGMILQDPKPINIKTLGSTIETTTSEPNPEIFNYRALNPTVETYVDCKNYDTSGACLDGGE